MPSKRTSGRLTHSSVITHLQSISPQLIIPVEFVPPSTSLSINEAASLGLVDGYSVVSKFGRNLVIDLGDTEDVWTVGGTKVWLVTAETLEILSSSGLDDAGSSGATKVKVQGLDVDWNDQEVEVTMDGANPVALSGTWRRVNRMFVSESGTYGGNNVGIITLRIADAGATQTNILAAVGQTEQTHFSIATGKTALLLHAYISTDSGKTINAEIYQHSGIDDIVAPFAGAKRKVWGITGLEGGHEREYQSFPSFVGPCDLWWQATSFAPGTEAEAGFDLLIKDD